MNDAQRSGTLARLKDRIAKLENRPVAAGAIASAGGFGTRRGAARFVPWRQAPAGLVHEVWTGNLRDAGAGLGFALGLVRPLLTPARPAIVWLQRQFEAAETGLAYGAGLAVLGIEPEAIVIGRMKQTGELLWAAEEALGCTGVAAVVADIAGYPRALDFTATRRLALRAARTGVSVVLVRYGPEKPASAAFMRWQVSPAPSGKRAFDERAGGAARFAVSLERSGSGLRGNWLLEWQDDGFGEIDADAERGARKAASGAVVPVLGHRLSRTA